MPRQVYNDECRIYDFWRSLIGIYIIFKMWIDSFILSHTQQWDFFTLPIHSIFTTWHVLAVCVRGAWEARACEVDHLQTGTPTVIIAAFVDQQQRRGKESARKYTINSLSFIWNLYHNSPVLFHFRNDLKQVICALDQRAYDVAAKAKT